MSQQSEYRQRWAKIGAQVNPSVKRPLKLARKALGLTQAAFAERFDIPLGTLRRWERDAHVSRAAIYFARHVQDVLTKSQ